jgi:septum formation protein
MQLPPSRLILASTSPYRQELLRRLCLPFTTIAPLVDETPHPNEAPGDLALRLARAKAHAVSARHANTVVIGSDQVATCAGHLLGKPHSFLEAQQQLRLLSGQEATFHSALAVTDSTRTELTNVLTHCRFRTLSEAAIDAYLHTEAPFNIAGSAKVEGLGIVLMAHIHSDDPTALIGLPLIALTDILATFGLDPLSAQGKTL